MGNILQKFSQNLKSRRKALGMTQRDLAEKISYSEKAVSKWESGAALPPSALLPTLSAILGMSIDALLMGKNEIRYYLGIDGGGSKTEFLLVNTDGNVINRLILGPSNPDDHGITDTEAVLKEGIIRILGNIPYDSVSVFAGISGSRANHVRDFLHRFDFAKIECGDSISCAFELCSQMENYVAINLGVGSIVFARYDSTFHRAGGYGYLFGDECSGYAFGKDVISAALHAEDGSGDETLIKDMLLRKLRSTSVTSSFYDIYKKRKGEISEYASLVFDAYEKGDAIAENILRKNCEALSRYIKGTLADFRGESIHVCIFGGVTAESDHILPLLNECLADFRVKCILTVSDKALVEGAVKAAGLK